MSASIAVSIHPLPGAPAPRVRLLPGEDPLATVEVGNPPDGAFFVRTTAEADALIRAFVAAKDLLTAAGVS